MIAETGSLTKAGELLGLSHSGLSKAIASLESETGLKLFRPQGRGLEITSEGQWFYKKALEILHIEKEVLAGVPAVASSLRIGLSEVIAVSCASLMANEVNSAMTLLETDVGELEGKILAGELDFGFIFSPAPRLELEYLQIGEVRFNAFATSNYQKGRKAADFEFAVPANQYPYNPMGFKVRDGWPDDLPRQKKFRVSSFAIALDLLRNSKTALYLPNFIAELENRRLRETDQFLKVPFYKKAETKRSLFLVKPKSSEESPAMKKLSKVLRKHCCIQ